MLSRANDPHSIGATSNGGPKASGHAVQQGESVTCAGGACAGGWISNSVRPLTAGVNACTTCFGQAGSLGVQSGV